MEVVFQEEIVAIAGGDAFHSVAGAQGGDAEVVAVERDVIGTGEMPGLCRA